MGTDTKTAETKEGQTLEEFLGAEGKGAAELATQRSKVAEVWTPERIKLIKDQICPAGITDDEFAIFLDKCRRSGLDPIMGECFCVPRTSKVKVRDPNGKIDPSTGKVFIFEKYVTQNVFQAAEHGMEVRAHRSGDFAGIRAGAIYEGDQCAIDFAEGRVVHRTDASKPRGKLVGAWAIATRKSVPIQPVAHVLFLEYAQDHKNWKEKPETMIVKCARSAALRLAFPAEFAGIYTAAEMSARIFDDDRDATPAQAERAVNEPPVEAGRAPSSKTDQLEELLKKKAGNTTVDAPKPERPAITRPDGKRVWLDDATNADLEYAEKQGKDAICDPKLTPEQLERSKVKLDQVRAEIKRRSDALNAAFGDAPAAPASSPPYSEPPRSTPPPAPSSGAEEPKK